jgi:hypothetical protein
MIGDPTPRISPNLKHEPRVMFNWGYHEAATDAERGRPRTLVASGPQTLEVVSAQHDAEYHAGYGYGLRYLAEGIYAPAKDSSAAWAEYSRLLQTNR